jgi:hypothetical protein
MRMEERNTDSALRFVVVDDAGRTSGLWYIKTAKNSDDVFLWELSTAGQFKISLHNEPTIDPGTSSQPWRLAMTREYAEAQDRPREVLWQGRPAPFAHGTILGPGVHIPRAFLQEADQMLPSRFVTYNVPGHAMNDGVVFRLILADNDRDLNAALARYQPFARLRRSGSGWVGVGTLESTMSASVIEAYEATVAEAQAAAESQGQPAVGRVVGVFTPDETGIPLLADLSSDSSSADL